MKSCDLMLIGPLSLDENIDYTGNVVHETGGAVFFGAHAAASSGADTFAAVKMAEKDRELLAAFGLDDAHTALLASEQTTIMTNTYTTKTRERRHSVCSAQSNPITAEELPQIPCRLYHLAGLLYGDLPEELIPLLKKRGKVSADMQGYLRHNEGGEMILRDWARKKDYLGFIDVLKADAAEAEVLTGTADRSQAARMLHDWGAGEVLISYNEAMLVYDGSREYTCPVKARNLSGRTGRGDTVFGAYLARRVKGEAPAEALRFATGAVSMKMEAPGPLRASEAEIRAYIKEQYGE